MLFFGNALLQSTSYCVLNVLVRRGNLHLLPLGVRINPMLLGAGTLGFDGIVQGVSWAARGCIPTCCMLGLCPWCSLCSSESCGFCTWLMALGIGKEAVGFELFRAGKA